ncbi:hypothetical protein DOE51_07250 [Bdellovibrio sp. NC01]|nr:hypothetical protein DOE51_07250 [Bdellovibrio sp. NC01]
MALQVGAAEKPYLEAQLQKTVDTTEGSLRILVFEGNDNTSFYEAPETSLPAVTELQKKVREQVVDTDPYALLKRQQNLFVRVGYTEFLPRFDLVMSKKIYSMSLLEQALLEIHSQVMKKPLFNSYSEFGANVLVKEQKIAIIFTSNESDAMVPDSKTRRQFLQKFLDAGYTYKFHIHNHPFNFDNPSKDIGGTTIPSGNHEFGDVGTYLDENKNLGLQNAWITNGFSSLHIPASEFSDY